MDNEKKKLIEKFTKEILFLDFKSQKYLAKLWGEGLNKQNRFWLKGIHFTLTQILYPGLKLQTWMEGRLRKNMSFTPRRVAYECRYYKRIKKEMTPYLISLARRVKDRLRKRIENKEEGKPIKNEKLEDSNERKFSERGEML